MKEFIINGHKWFSWLPEENPELAIKIINEARRLNELDSSLIKINFNTWRKREDSEIL